MAFDKPFLIIGHRGAAGLEPENTLRSFRRAMALGVDAVELDVYAVNGELLVIHDDTLERTTNGHGPLDGLPLAALRSLDAGAGERIPTLAEALAELLPTCGVNIELKGSGGAAPVAGLLETIDPGADVLVSSFRHDELVRFETLRPGTRLAPLYGRRSPDLDQLPVHTPWAVNISLRIATPALVDAIRDAGCRCLVYTVNDPADATRLRRAGASGVFTDYPDRVRAD